jgi:hypothetical protein
MELLEWVIAPHLNYLRGSQHIVHLDIRRFHAPTIQLLAPQLQVLLVLGNAR